MMDEDQKWFRVSLHILGDAVDPVTLESGLGLVPTRIGIKGDAYVGKSGRTYYHFETNAWIYNVPVPSDMGFDAQIQTLFRNLGSHRSKLKALCHQAGVECGLFCGFGSGNGQGGDTLQAETLKLLGDTGLSFTLDLYPPDANEVAGSEP